MNVDTHLEIEGRVVRCVDNSVRMNALTRVLSRRTYGVAVTFTNAAPDLRREVSGRIFRTEVYARGLGD